MLDIFYNVWGGFANHPILTLAKQGANYFVQYIGGIQE